MALNDDQLAGILQATINFAKEILEQLAVFTPFGGQVKQDGELEFFAPAPSENDEVTFDSLSRQVQSVLIENARTGSILAGVMAMDVVVPEAIETPFRHAIGVFIEAPGACRFVYATYDLPHRPAEGERVEVQLGQMITVEGKPAIFAS